MGVRDALLVGLVTGVALASGCKKDDASDGEAAAETPSAAASAERTTKTSSSPALDGFAVVADDTHLYRRPSPDAPRISLRAESGHATFAIAEVKGEWIGLRSVDEGDDRQHCVPGWDPLQDFDVTLWVERSALRIVTRHTVLFKDDAGASVMLAAGTPLDEAADARGARRYRVAPLGLLAEIHEDSVGSTYQPGPLFPARTPTHVLPRDSEALRFGGESMRAEALNAPDGDSSTVAVYARTTSDSQTLLSVAHPCAELRLPEPPNVEPTPLPPPKTAVAILGTVGAKHSTVFELLADAERYTAPSGSKLFWPDGETAGTLRREHTFSGSPSVESDKRCFEYGAGSSRLCLRADDLKHVTPSVELDAALSGLTEAESLIEGGVGIGPKAIPGGVPGGVDPGSIAELMNPDEIEEALREGAMGEGLIGLPDEGDESDEGETDGGETDGGETGTSDPEPEPEPEPEPAPAPSPKVEPAPEVSPTPGGSRSASSAAALSSISVSGSLTKADVRTVAKRNGKKVRACFARHGGPGSLKIALTISPGGTVNIAKVKSNSAGSKPLADCVLKAARTWSFPKPAGGGMAVARIRWSIAP